VVDISETIVALAGQRLARFGDRAEVYRSDGSPRLCFGAATFDRFVANYVLDLLCVEEIEMLLQEASRVLSAGGLLGLTSLIFGFTPFSRMVSTIWQALHSLRPGLVGGCRPLHLRELVSGRTWQVRNADRFSSFGVPSEVLIARKVTV